jgi:hypothetical protein
MPELFDKHGGFRKLHTFTLATVVQFDRLDRHDRIDNKVNEVNPVPWSRPDRAGTPVSPERRA